MTGDRALVRKVAGRLLPFLFFLYIIAYLDRVNVNFAQLKMTWFSKDQYGTGAGIFFLGYFLFEVPSNLILRRVGARIWIARIMVTWGFLAMAMIFVKERLDLFYGLRFLLGFAEAGFFPGVLLYLTYWFTARERARAVALFMTANAVTLSLGSPISGLLIDRPALWGLEGWQQMFFFEGLPAVLMAGVVLWYLPNGPEQAKWLTEEEKARIAERLRHDEARRDPHGSLAEELRTLGAAVRLPRVWLFCAVYFCLVTGMYGLGLWVAELIKELLGGAASGLTVGALCVPVFATSGVCMVANATHSDRTHERRLHVLVPALLGAAGLVGYALLQGTPWAALVALTVAVSGMWSTLGPFWAMPPRLLGATGGAALAGGIALINSVGNLGGFVGPKALGMLPSLQVGLFFLAVSVALGALLALPAGAERDHGA